MASEFWYEPTPDTMIAADASLSSIATSNSARVAYGWRMFEEMLGGVYVGPDVEYFGSDGYRHLRLGAHAHQHEGRRDRMVGRRRLGAGLRKAARARIVRLNHAEAAASRACGGSA